MASKYQALATHLAAQPEDQSSILLTFGELDRLVGGLPPSARMIRQWWANSSHGQAQAWREAGWHVDAVDFAGHQVRFARGRVGGTRADRIAAERAAPRATPPAAPAATEPAAVAAVPDPARTTAPHVPPILADEVAVSVRFSWRHLGELHLDAAGKVAFPPALPQAPGLYCMHFTATGPERPERLYIGETDNLRRRLASNYRNPGPRQQTSLRINKALRTHLADGGAATLAITLSAQLAEPDREPEPLDLTRKAGRLLAESAALVLAQRASLSLENLG